MSMQQGAETVGELIVVVEKLAKDMQKFYDCENGMREIVITVDEEDGSFLITSD